MQRFGIGAQELKMARLLWEREGIGSGAVVKLCAEEMGWKKSTTYTMEESENKLFIGIDDWFKDNLPEPEPCVNHEKVITFFKCETATDMYEKLKPAIALLDKYNKAYDVLYTNFVGTIVYEDEWQIAVKVDDGKMI